MVGSINEKHVAQADNKHAVETPDAPLSVDSREHHNIDAKAHHTHGIVAKEKDLDKAYLYMNEHSNEADNVEAEAIDLVKLRRKIDWRIVPIMFAW